MKARSERVGDRHRRWSRHADDRRHRAGRSPASTFDQHPRHLEPAGGLPVQGHQSRVRLVRIPHDPQEITRRDPFSDRITYDWSVRHG